MTDPFEVLARECGLKHVSGTSPDGLAERYLYLPDDVYRYAFGRWWGHTDPHALKSMAEAVGDCNDRALRLITAAGQRTVAAWGSRGRLRGRSAEVRDVLSNAYCLGTTRSGEPRHPLYVPAATQLVPL